MAIDIMAGVAAVVLLVGMCYLVFWAGISMSDTYKQPSSDRLDNPRDYEGLAILKATGAGDLAATLDSMQEHIREDGGRSLLKVLPETRHILDLILYKIESELSQCALLDKADLEELRVILTPFRTQAINLSRELDYMELGGV